MTGDEEWGSQQQQIVTIELPNDGRQGFGFGVVSVGESKKTVVHSLVPGGVAEQVHCFRVLSSSGRNCRVGCYIHLAMHEYTCIM